MKTFKAFIREYNPDDYKTRLSIPSPWRTKDSAAKFVGITAAGIAMSPAGPPMLGNFLSQKDVVSDKVVKNYLEKKKKEKKNETT